MDTYRNLATEDKFVDGDGTAWTRRGGYVEGRQLGRALRAPDLVVLHDYLGEVTPVTAPHREEFWAAAERKMRESGYADFYGATFRSPARARLLVVHEDC